MCSTHSQHIRNHVCNNFPHLHNVNRGLETSKIREKQVFTLSVPQSAATGRYRPLLAVISEFLNPKLLVMCSTHSQHIRNHICNNFPHLHNVNRGLETSKICEKQVSHCASENKDKTQPQRCQERAGLKDNTTHTPYMEFLTFFLIHNTPNEVCKQAKIEKIEKNS